MWFTEHELGCYWDDMQGISRFNSVIQKRREKYPFKQNKYENVLDNLNKKGYYIIREAIDESRIVALKEELDTMISAGDGIKRKNQYEIVVDSALLNTKNAPKLAFDDLLVDIASAYFGATPMIGTVNLRKSFVTDAPEEGTLLFHCDKNSTKFIKFFIYLNDVDEKTGPFCYTEGSHKQKFYDWKSKYRWNHEEIENIYGKDRIKYLTGKAGDVLVANTTGFHRGVKCAESERRMLTVNYVVHPEFWLQPSEKLDKDFYDQLPENKKPVADLLVKE